MNFDNVVDLIESSVQEGISPSISTCVIYKGEHVFSCAHGAKEYSDIENKVLGERVNLNTYYDIASLTKIIATTPLAMVLEEEGIISLDSKVTDFFPEFKGDEITIYNLLSHTSGLNWWRPFYERFINQMNSNSLSSKNNKDVFKKYVLEEMPVAKPFERFTYSDLNYIFLTYILEKAGNKPFDVLVREKVFDRIGMSETLFNKADSQNKYIPISNSAATELTPERGLVKGIVHDENCYYMGGVSGHAGVFSTLADLGLFTQNILQILDGKKGFVRQGILEKYITKISHENNTTRAIGFDTKSPKNSSCGNYFNIKSFGHLGFTGCSLWIDPVNKIGSILLTNRVHPTRFNTKITSFRPKFHDTLAKDTFWRQ